MKRHTSLLMAMIAASIFLFFLLNLLIGSVDIPLSSVVNILLGGEEQSVVWQNIVLKSRVPQALTALVAGAGLSISGLQMQTVFRNPLAGPSVLGISSGASLGVGGYGHHRIRITKSKRERYVAHYWCYDWLRGQCHYRRIEILQCGGRYTGLCYLGAGQFLARIG